MCDYFLTHLLIWGGAGGGVGVEEEQPNSLLSPEPHAGSIMQSQDHYLSKNQELDTTNWANQAPQCMCDFYFTLRIFQLLCPWSIKIISGHL